ncbi:MAG: 2-hydroxychromene-2-carboxylate isomerase [Polyangiales bacterium]
MTTREPVTFYFDFISPYAYLAWKRVHAVAEAKGREVNPAPVLFAAMLDAHGTKGPAEVPAKRVYVFKDASRRAALAGLPLVPPPAHPFNPLLALRVASLDLDPDLRRAVIDALYDATWGGGPGVTDPATVAGIVSRARVDGEAAVRAASTDAVKRRVRERTDEAIARGVFGVPTLYVDGELFWGYESLDLAALRMEGEDPVDAAGLERWRDLPTGAKRPGAG